MRDFLFKTIENHPVLVTAGIFVLSVVVSILSYLIKRWFLKENDSALIKAGGDITAGGDIIAGNKAVINRNGEANGKNLKNFERFVENEEWKKEFINNDEAWICQKDNTYQIELSKKDHDFSEEWTEVYPDKKSYLYHVYLKIGNAVIKELDFVAVDGWRIFVPLPQSKIEKDGKRIFIWYRKSLEYKVGEIIGKFYIYRSFEGVAKMSKIKII